MQTYEPERLPYPRDPAACTRNFLIQSFTERLSSYSRTNDNTKRTSNQPRGLVLKLTPETKTNYVYYCFDISFQRVFTNINLTTDFCTLCKKVSRFFVKIVLSHNITIPKNFVGEPFGVKNFYASEGYVTIFDFLSKFFCLTVPKIFVGESFTVAVISGTGKVWIRSGEYRDFLSKFFVSQCRNIS